MKEKVETGESIVCKQKQLRRKLKFLFRHTYEQILSLSQLKMKPKRFNNNRPMSIFVRKEYEPNCKHRQIKAAFRIGFG